jgi:hypothetical protein
MAFLVAEVAMVSNFLLHHVRGRYRKGEWPHYEKYKWDAESGKWKKTGERLPRNFLKDEPQNAGNARKPYVSKDNPWGKDPNAQPTIDLDEHFKDYPPIIIMPGAGPGAALGPLIERVLGGLRPLLGF